MPKYYCDYCDTFLTHDSPSVRKTHNGGRKHKDNKWMEDQAQKLVDQTARAFATNKMAGAVPRTTMGMPGLPQMPRPPMPGFPGMPMVPGMPPRPMPVPFPGAAPGFASGTLPAPGLLPRGAPVPFRQTQ